MEREKRLEIKNKFVSIKVKKQNYLGKPAVAIYMNDYTEKI